MKFTAKTKELLRAVAMAEQASKSRTPMPILNHLLIEPEGEKLKITGCDLEVWVSSWCEADISDPEPFCVPAFLLKKVLEGSGADDFMGEYDWKRLKITLNLGVFTLPVLQASEFTKCPEVTGEAIPILTEKLSKMVSKTEFARIALGQERIWLEGLILTVKNGILRLWGSNGVRISIAETPSNGNTEALVPRKLVPILLNLESEPNDMSIMTISDRLIQLNGHYGEITGSLPNSAMPSCDQFLTTKPTISACVDRKGFLNALSRAAIMVTDRYFGVDLELRTDSITCKSEADVQGGSEIIALTGGPAEPFTIRINHENFIMALRRMESETVTLEIIDAMSPVYLKEEGFVFLNAPLRNTTKL